MSDPSEVPAQRLAWRRFASPLAALLAMVPHLGILLGTREFFHDDHFRFTVPLARLVSESLRAGHLPLWNPWVLTGTPLVSERGGMVAHPGLWLALLFEPSHAVGILMVIFLAILALGTTSLLLALRARAAIALAAGVAASMIGPALSYTSNAPFLATLAFYPLTLLAALRLARAQGGVLLGGFALGMAILGGDLPGALLLSILALATYLIEGGRLPGWRSLALVLGVALLLGAGTWYPVTWALPISERAAGIVASESGRWSFHPIEWLGFLWPHPMGLPLPDFSFWPFLWQKGERLFLHSIWIGALVAGAAAWSLGRGGERHARAWVILALGLLLVAMGAYSPAWPWLRHLFTFLRYPSKLAAPAALLLFLAGSLSLSRLCDHPRGLGRLALAVMGLGLAGIAIGPFLINTLSLRDQVPADVAKLAASGLREGAGRVAGLGALVSLAAWLHARGRLPVGRLIPLVALVLVVDVSATNVDLLWTRPPMGHATPGYLPAMDPRGVRVMRLSEVTKGRLGRNIAGFSEEQARSAQLLQPLTNLGAHVGVMEPYGLYPGDLGKSMSMLNGHDPLWTAELLGVDLLLASPTARAGWLQKGVDEKHLLPSKRLEAGALVLELPDALPRSYLAFSALADTKDGVLARLAKHEGREVPLVVADRGLRGGQVRSLSLPELPTAQDRMGGIRPLDPVAWRPGHSRYRLEIESPALLVELDAFLPGWRAYVDGVEATIVEVNLMTRGVIVPAGAHEVEFRFGTFALIASLFSSWLTILGIAIAVVLRFLGRGRPRNERRPPSLVGEGGRG